MRSDDWTHMGALPPQVGPIKFLPVRAPMSLNVETARSRIVLNDGPERLIERNMAAANLCRNATIVHKDLIRGVKAEPADYDHIDNAMRIIALVLFNPDVLETLAERARTEIPEKSWPLVGHAIRFLRARVCAPRDMPLRSMEQFVGAANWFLRVLGQEL